MPQKNADNLEEKLFRKRENIWKNASKEEVDKIFKFSDYYMDFLSEGKTERLMVKRAVRELKEAGFTDVSKASELKPGDKVFKVNRERGVFAAVIGKNDMIEGANLVAAHIDSPRLDLKGSPIIEDADTETLFLKTHYYGGIKKYQWLNTPLSLHGVVVKENGESVEIHIGDDPEDPIFMIGDLLIHLSRKKQGKKKLFEAFQGEDLNIFAGHMPHGDEDAKSPIKLKLMQILNDKYGIVEEDLVSADIEAVPAGPARDLGFDRGLIAGYGQDDRICSITALKALMDLGTPQRTAMVALYDKEEVGSGGNTGAQSMVLESFIARIMELKDSKTRYSQVKTCLENTRALSADVDAGMHPNYKDVHESQNAARLSHGIVLSKFSGVGGKSGGNEASAEYLGTIRKMFKENNVPWQNAELGKVDEGGGGTVAKFLANFNMEIIDCGPALISMHAPMEISSKADVYFTYMAYKTFLS